MGKPTVYTDPVDRYGQILFAHGTYTVAQAEAGITMKQFGDAALQNVGGANVPEDMKNASFEEAMTYTGEKKERWLKHLATFVDTNNPLVTAVGKLAGDYYSTDDNAKSKVVSQIRSYIAELSGNASNRAQAAASYPDVAAHAMQDLLQETHYKIDEKGILFSFSGLNNENITLDDAPNLSQIFKNFTSKDLVIPVDATGKEVPFWAIKSTEGLEWKIASDNELQYFQNELTNNPALKKALQNIVGDTGDVTAAEMIAGQVDELRKKLKAGREQSDGTQLNEVSDRLAKEYFTIHDREDTKAVGVAKVIANWHDLEFLGVKASTQAVNAGIGEIGRNISKGWDNFWNDNEESKINNISAAISRDISDEKNSTINRVIPNTRFVVAARGSAYTPAAASNTDVAVNNGSDTKDKGTGTPPAGNPEKETKVEAPKPVVVTIDPLKATRELVAANKEAFAILEHQDNKSVASKGSDMSFEDKLAKAVENGLSVEAAKELDIYNKQKDVLNKTGSENLTAQIEKVLVAKDPQKAFEGSQLDIRNTALSNGSREDNTLAFQSYAKTFGIGLRGEGTYASNSTVTETERGMGGR